MDQRLKEILEKNADLSKIPFVQNALTEKIIDDTGGEGLYNKIEVDLTVAHTDLEIPVSADRLVVESVDDAVTIKLNSPKNPTIDLQLIPKIKGAVKRIYVNNASGSGTLKLLAGSKGMVDFKKKLNLGLAIADYVIYKDGSYFKCADGSDGSIDKSTSSAPTAIQYAIDALTPYAGTIYIKPVRNGLYEIDTDIIIANGHKGLNMLGGGFTWAEHGTVLKATANLTNAIIDDKMNGIGFHKFIGLSFWGNEASLTTGDDYGLKTICQDTVVQHCSFKDSWRGLYVKGNALVEGCWIENNNNTGIMITGAKPKIKDNIFWQNGIYDILITSEIDNALVSGNTTAGTGTDYFVAFNAVANAHEKCIFMNNIGYNLDLAMFYLWRNNHTAMSFTNNILDGNAHTTNMFKVDGSARVYTDIIIRNNISYDTTGNMFTGDLSGLIIDHNQGYVTENGGTSGNIADGGTIAHGCGTTPTHVSVVGTVSGEFIQVTALDATNITVAIKTHAGAGGTAQPIYWRAWV